MSVGGYASAGGYGEGSFARLSRDLENAAIQFGSMASVAKTFKSSLTVFAVLQDEIIKTGAVAGASAQEIDKMGQAVRRLSLGSRTTATEAAAALYFLASAGLDAKQALEALSGVSMLASATMEPIGQAADIVASALSSFKLQAYESTRVANVFVASSLRSQATLDKLAYSMRQVAPAAAAAGLSIEETSAMLNILYNSGLRGEQAGTVLRNTLVELSSPTTRASRLLQEFGLSTLEAAGGLENMLKQLGQYRLGLGQIETLVGKEAASGFLTLVSAMNAAGAGMSEYQKMLSSISDTNAAFEQSLRQNQSLLASFAIMRNNITEVATAFGESLAPYAEDAARAIRDVARSFIDLDRGLKDAASIQGAVMLLGGAAVVLAGPMLAAATRLLGPMRLLLSFVGQVGAAFAYIARIGSAVFGASGIASGLLVTIARFTGFGIAVTGLGLAFSYLNKKIEEFARAESGDYGSVQLGRFVDYVDKYQDAIKTLETAYQDTDGALADRLRARQTIVELAKVTSDEINKALDNLESEMVTANGRRNRLQAEADNLQKVSLFGLDKGFSRLPAGYSNIEQVNARYAQVREELDLLDELQSTYSDRQAKYQERSADLKKINEEQRNKQIADAKKYIDALAKNPELYSRLISDKIPLISAKRSEAMSALASLSKNASFGKAVEDLKARTERDPTLLKESNARDSVKSLITSMFPDLGKYLTDSEEDVQSFISQSMRPLESFVRKGIDARIDALDTMAQLIGYDSAIVSNKLRAISIDVNETLTKGMQDFVQNLREDPLAQLKSLTGKYANGETVDAEVIAGIFSNTMANAQFFAQSAEAKSGDWEAAQQKFNEFLRSKTGDFFTKASGEQQKVVAGWFDRFSALVAAEAQKGSAKTVQALVDGATEGFEQRSATLATAFGNILKTLDLGMADAVNSIDFSKQRSLLAERYLTESANVDQQVLEAFRKDRSNPVTQAAIQRVQALQAAGQLEADAVDDEITRYIQSTEDYQTARDLKQKELAQGQRAANQKLLKDESDFVTARSTALLSNAARLADANAQYLAALYPYNEEAVASSKQAGIEAKYKADIANAYRDYESAMVAIGDQNSINGQRLVQEASDSLNVAIQQAQMMREQAIDEAEKQRIQSMREGEYALASLVQSVTTAVSSADKAMSGFSLAKLGEAAATQFNMAKSAIVKEQIELERALALAQYDVDRQLNGPNAITNENERAKLIAYIETYTEWNTARQAQLKEMREAELTLYALGVHTHEQYIDYLEKELALAERLARAHDSMFGGFGVAARQAYIDAQSLLYDLGHDAYTIMSDRLSAGLADAFTGSRVKWKQLLQDMAADWLKSGITSVIKGSFANVFAGGAAGVLSSAQANSAGASGGSTLSMLSAGKSIYDAIAGGLSTPLLTGGLANAVDNLGGLLYGGSLSGEAAKNFGAFSKSFTPGAAIAGLAGNFGANALFGDRGMGANIGGTVGGLGGTFATPAITTALLGTPFAPVAPFIGPLLGSFAGNAFGGLFGGKQSDATAAGTYNLVTGASTLRDLGKKTTQANLDYRDAVSGFAEGFIAQMIADTDKYVTANLSLRIGSRDGLRYSLNNGAEANFGANQGAFFKGLTTDLLGLFSDVEQGQQRVADVSTALAHIDFSNTEKALSDISFAMNFTDLGKTKEDLSAAKQALNELSDTFNEAATTASRLGLSVDYVRQKQAEAENKLREDFLKSMGDAYVNTVSSSIGTLTDIMDEYKTQLDNARDYGVDNTVVRMYYEERLRQAMATVNESENQRIAVLKKSSDEAEQWASKWRSVSDSLRDTMDKLNVSSASPASPYDRYLEAKRQFQAAAALAKSGNTQEALDAAGKLDGLQSTFLSLSKEYYASSIQYAQDFALVQDSLASAQEFASRQVSVQQQTIDAIKEQTSVILSGNEALIAALTQSAMSNGLVDYTTGGANKVYRTNGTFSGYISKNNFNYLLTEGIRTNSLTSSQIDQLKGISAALFPSVKAGNGAFDMAYEENAAKNLQAILLARQYGIPGFARGGYTPSNRPFLVGENGPELMMSGRSHTVIPLSGTSDLADSFDEYRKQSALETSLLVERLDALNNQIEHLSRNMERIAKK